MLCSHVLCGFAMEIAYRIHVSAGSVAHQQLPVQISLAELPDIQPQETRLVEIIEGQRVEIPFQVIEGKNAAMCWKLDGVTQAGTVRVFELEKSKPTPTDGYTANKTPDELILSDQRGSPLLVYRHSWKEPPSGVSAKYGRGAYIHPLYTLSGKVLTNIQPPDHYHHYGIWNPWTRVDYNGQTYDLWNLNDNKGTVRFGRFNSIFQGPVGLGFDAIHDHIIFNEGIEEQIIREHWNVNVFPVDESYYICDIHSFLEAVGGHDVVLKEYRYGGLTFRATAKWNNRNSQVITSSGKTRRNADGSLERWGMVYGEIDGAPCGILLMSHPENQTFPEPIRVWPPLANMGRGDQFFNFSPTKYSDWTLERGNSYTLTYRLVIFDGHMTSEEAESLWQSFAYPPHIEIQKI